MPRKHLKQRADGRYCAVYKGKQFLSYDHDEALKLRDAYKYRCEHDIDEIRKISVRDYAAEWLPLYKYGEVQLNTYNQYAHLFERLCAIIGDIHMSSVTPDDVARVWKSFQGESHSQMRKAVSLFRALFDSAIESGYCRRNPFRSSAVSTPKGTEGSHRAIEDWERRLIETTPHRLQLGAMIMLYSGIRRGELLALQYNHIDSDHLTIHHAVSFAGAKPIVKGTKNKSSMRTVPLLDPLRPWLFDENGQPKKKIGYIVPRVDGSICTQPGWKRAWESYLFTLETSLNGCQKRWYHRTREWKQSHPEEWAKYETLRRTKPKEAESFRLMGWRTVSIRPHDLRHSFCEWAITNGVDPKTLMKWLGHTDERMIMQIYDHVMARREDAAITMLNKAYANDMQHNQQPVLRAL